MKIGILTFHKAINYGAVLQCWALYEFLKQQGYQMRIIDYVPSYMRGKYSSFSLTGLKNTNSIKGKMYYLLLHLIKFFSIRKRNNVFKNFTDKHFKYIDINEINKSLDVIIVGSDQVWNTQLTGGYDSLYFLENVNDSIKKVVYAASSELSFFKKAILSEPRILKAINNINYISVREDVLREELYKHGLNNIDVTIDPTLLLEKEKYDEMVSDRLVKSNYLLVYQVVFVKNTMRIANKIAKQRNLKLIFLNAKFKFFHKEKNIKQSIGPIEFLNLFKYADFVVTTSFHGVIFSVIFEKQFCLVKVEDISRHTAILSKLNISDRIIEDENELIQKELEYDNEFHKRKNNYIIDSTIYLKRAIVDG